MRPRRRVTTRRSRKSLLAFPGRPGPALWVLALLILLAPATSTAQEGGEPDPADPLLGDWPEDWVEDPPADEEELPSYIDFDPVRGIRFQGPDGVPRLRVGGRIQLTTYLYDDRNQRDSEIRPEGGQIRLDGSALAANRFRAVFDLDGRDSVGGISEGWVAHAPTHHLRTSIGLLPLPLGIEESIPADELPFTGPAFGTWLDYRTDLALRVDGEVMGGFLSYDGAWAFGEGFTVEGERVDDPRLSLRLSLYPLTTEFLAPDFGSGAAWLHGLFLNVSYSYEPSWRRPIEVETPYRNRLFQTTPLRADSAEFIHLGWGLDAGRLRVIHERVVGSLNGVATSGGSEDLDDQITSWAISASWRFGGPDYDTHAYRQRAIPGEEDWTPPGEGEEPSAPTFRFPGDVEVGVRYANADIDRRFFSLGLASFADSSQEFRTFTGAISIRPSRTLRVIAEVTRVIADQFPAAFDSHGRDTSFALRVEYIF